MLRFLKRTLILIIEDASLISNCSKCIVDYKSIENQWKVNEESMNIWWKVDFK